MFFLVEIVSPKGLFSKRNEKCQETCVKDKCHFQSLLNLLNSAPLIHSQVTILGSQTRWNSVSLASERPCVKFHEGGSCCKQVLTWNLGNFMILTVSSTNIIRQYLGIYSIYISHPRTSLHISHISTIPMAPSNASASASVVQARLFSGVSLELG